MAFPMRAVFAVANRFMAKTSKSGVYVTTSPEVDGVSGQYFVGKTGQELAFDQAYKDRLWERTVAMLG